MQTLKTKVNHEPARCDGRGADVMLDKRQHYRDCCSSKALLMVDHCASGIVHMLRAATEILPPGTCSAA